MQVTRRESYKKQNLLTLPEHMRLPPVFFGGVRVAHLFSFVVLSYYATLCSKFRVVVSVTMSA